MALYHHKSFHAFTSHKSTIQEMGTRIAWCLLFWVYTCSLSLGSLKHTLYRTCRWRGALPQPSIMADLSKPRLGYSMRLFTYTSEVYFESSILKREAKQPQTKRNKWNEFRPKAVHLLDKPGDLNENDFVPDYAATDNMILLKGYFELGMGQSESEIRESITEILKQRFPFVRPDYFCQFIQS